jgi:hypothetical protein
MRRMRSHSSVAPRKPARFGPSELSNTAMAAAAGSGGPPISCKIELPTVGGGDEQVRPSFTSPLGTQAHLERSARGMGDLACPLHAAPEVVMKRDVGGG